MYYLSQMCEYLLGLDENLLLLVNGYHTPFLDKVMWTISDRWAWMPLYMLLAVILYRKSGLKMGLVCAAAHRGSDSRHRPDMRFGDTPGTLQAPSVKSRQSGVGAGDGCERLSWRGIWIPFVSRRKHICSCGFPVADFQKQVCDCVAGRMVGVGVIFKGLSWSALSGRYSRRLGGRVALCLDLLPTSEMV